MGALLLVSMLGVVAWSGASQPGLRPALAAERLGGHQARFPRAPELRQTPPRIELVAQVGGAALDLAVRGSHAYVGVGPRLASVDVSDPSSPFLVGRTSPLRVIAEHVRIAGSSAYVAGGLTQGGAGGQAAVAVSGQTVLVASGSGGIWIFRITGPSDG